MLTTKPHTTTKRQCHHSKIILLPAKMLQATTGKIRDHGLGVKGGGVRNGMAGMNGSAGIFGMEGMVGIACIGSNANFGMVGIEGIGGSASLDTVGMAGTTGTGVNVGLGVLAQLGMEESWA